MANLVDSVLKMFTKERLSTASATFEPGSRAEKEARIKSRAGLVINLFALFLALNAWYGGKLSTTVLNNTISANNQWSWYQAKNVRGVIYETSALTSSQQDAEKLLAEAARMNTEKKEIAEVALKIEQERDDAKRRTPWIGYASTAYQLSIVLLSASILAVSMPLFWASFGVAGIGLLLSLNGIFLWL